MGLLGLWSYEERQRLGIPFHLRDTKLLIDGNSFSKCLFANAMSEECFKAKYFYGGDYADYSAQVRLFFDKLAHCNVEPIVIFDGCSKMDMEPSARLARHRHQYETRLNNAVKLCASGAQQVDQVALCPNQPNWSSISTVLFEVMRQLDIVHRQCVTKEADDIISVIARYYNCPVLTMDSDFLIWDLPGGVIEMKHFFRKYPNLSDSSSKYIECSIYYRENGLLAHLETKYGFKRELLPLVGPLFGYDQVDAQIATRFISHAQRDQLSKLKVNFRTHIRSILQQFASQFGSFKERDIANDFVQSTREKLENSIEHFHSMSERELQKVEKSMNEKLNAIVASSKSSIELKCKLNEIGRQFVEDLAQFEETVKAACDGQSFNAGLYDRSLAAFRWLSSQPTLNKAKEKLTQFCLELKTKNLGLIQKNARNKHNSWYKVRGTFKSVEFDRFMTHVKKEIPISLFYEDLESNIRNIQPDLPIGEFLYKMQEHFFPQAPGIPSVFHRDLVQGLTNPHLLNIFYTKLVLIPSPIENYETLSSSYECTFDLDPYIYGIILKQDEEVTRVYRKGTKLVHAQVQAKFDINGKPLPNLEQISNMTQQDRRDLLFTIIQQVCFTREVNIDELMNTMQKALPSLSQTVLDAFLLMILSLIMCKCHSDLTCSPKWNPFRSAMLLNIVALGYIGHKHSGVPTFLDLDRDKIELIRTKFANQTPSTIDLTLSHYFNAYHNCIQSLNFLTQLLNLYEYFQLDRFVCGLQGSFVNAMSQQYANGESNYESTLKSMDLPNAINDF